MASEQKKTSKKQPKVDKDNFSTDHIIDKVNKRLQKLKEKHAGGKSIRMDSFDESMFDDKAISAQI